VGLLSLSPSGSVGAEDIRHLECGTHHDLGLQGLQSLQWTHHLTQDIGGHLGI